MATQSVNGTMGETRSELVQLWETAVEDYEKMTGKSLRLDKLRTIDEIMNRTEGLSNKFKDFRDDKSKVTKVRNAFKNNLWLIQIIVNTVQNIGDAASAFPPAMPASLIFTAFGQVMQSFADVSSDYDKILGFFEYTHRFFDRLTIIEKKMPALPSFHRCVARVFSSMLKICSIAQKYAKEKRLKKWFEALVKGSDGDLAAADKEIEEAVNELSQAVGLATLRSVEILDEILRSMNGNVEFLVSKATIMDERTEEIKSNTTTIVQQNRNLDIKQDVMTEIQQQTLELVKEQSQMLNDIVRSFESVRMSEDFAKDFQTSLLKLDVIRLRLTRWGLSIGLTDIDHIKALQDAKLSPQDIPEVEDLLKGISDQFADAERISMRFQKRSGNSNMLVLDPAKDLDKDPALLHQRMYDIVKERQGNTELEPKAELILYEEKNFTRLVEDISELVDGLIDLFPGLQEEQRKLCEEEVTVFTRTKDALSLLKEVAADHDKMLSEAIVKAIQASSTTNYTNSVVFSGANSGFQIGNNMGSISGLRFG